jgi:predicted nucleic acid-binding protein
VSVFADTSALYALLVATEEGHAEVARAFGRLLARRQPLHTTSYVIVETIALLQHRLGLDPVRDFAESIVPVLAVEYVDENIHRKGVDRLLRESRRRLSLVDCVSLEFMRERGITAALALDRHFADAGCQVLPDRVSSLK